MKKTLNIITLSVLIALSLSIGIKAFLRKSPNFATNKHESGLHWDYTGYVQVKPSYNDKNRHAQAGYVRYRIPKNWAFKGKDSGRKYTKMGTHEGDSRLLSRTYRFYDTSVIGAEKTRFNYGFIWKKHTGNPRTPWTNPLNTELPIEK